MAKVARLEFTRNLFDKSPSITISPDKILTIKIALKADILEEMRTVDPGEEFNFRDSTLDSDLTIGNTVKVKLLKIDKKNVDSTLIIEADIHTKVPGTGGLISLEKSRKTTSKKSNKK
jgi:hypothetical protein